MHDTLSRSARIWFFSNLIGSLCFPFWDVESAGPLLGEIIVIFFFGLIFSSSVVFTSALGIGLLKKLPAWRELRFAFMALTGLVSVTLVVLMGYSFTATGPWDFSEMMETAKFLLPHCIAGVITSIFFTRDLIFIRSEKALTKPYENTEL